MEDKITAMIPARLGSKRISRKNIRYMDQKPLIQYPIDLALDSGLFAEVWVNTESEELGRLVQTMGACFHRRPAEFAGDHATNREFMYEFVKKHDCDYVVMMNTTSPLLRESTVKKFIEFIRANDYDTVVSVTAQKEETFFRDKPLNFSLEEKVNSQLLEPTEAIVWALTAWKTKTFIRLQEEGKNPVFGGSLAKFVIPKDEACDLDTEEDWRIAEGILESRKTNREKRYVQL